MLGVEVNVRRLAVKGFQKKMGRGDHSPPSMSKTRSCSGMRLKVS